MANSITGQVSGTGPGSGAGPGSDRSAIIQQSVDSHDPASVSAIEVREMNLWYGDFQALHDVNLDIKAGIVTSMIGPSGCGKSTLLRSCNRINERLDYVRTTGTIKVLGEDIYDDSASRIQVRRHVGMVFQRPNPLPLSIRDTALLAHRLDRIACAFCSRPRHVISGAALSCASKALAEQAGANKELEQIVLWLSDVWGSLQHEEDLLRNCADLLDAAGAVVDYQLLFGVSIEVAVVCGDGSVLQALASRLGELADAIANEARLERLS